MIFNAVSRILKFSQRPVQWLKHLRSRTYWAMCRKLGVMDDPGTHVIAAKHHLDPPPWHDPTYGRIDRDIQELVDSWHPSGIGSRVAMENTLQSRRDGR